MKQVYKIDSEGYYIEPVILYPREEEQEFEVTPEPYTDDDNNVIRPDSYTETRKVAVYDVPDDCVEPQPPSYYKARWQGEEWIEVGHAPEQEPQPPTTDEKVATLEQQNEQLKNSVAFLEDMIVILTMP